MVNMGWISVPTINLQLALENIKTERVKVLAGDIEGDVGVFLWPDDERSPAYFLGGKLKAGPAA
jgi:hypothetical protein